MREKYGKLIFGYKALLNKTEFIPSLSNNNNSIRTIAELLEILIIQCTRDLNWFNRLIINIPTHTKLIIKVLFSHNFRQYLTKIKNKKKQQLVGWLMNKLERFFKKVYKIRVAAIPGLLKLIQNNLSLNLTWNQFYKND